MTRTRIRCGRCGTVHYDERFSVCRDCGARLSGDDRLYCDDPAHGAECDCGATPDLDYERGVVRRAER